MAKLEESLAFNMKRLRQENGVGSQADLAKKAGIDLGVIKRAEAGRGIPQSSSLKAIAKALGLKEEEETELFRDPKGIADPSVNLAALIMIEKAGLNLDDLAALSNSRAHVPAPKPEDGEDPESAKDRALVDRYLAKKSGKKKQESTG